MYRSEVLSQKDMYVEIVGQATRTASLRCLLSVPVNDTIHTFSK